MAEARIGAAAAGIVLALALAGCGSTPEPPKCPPVSVLSEAASLTRFAPGRGRDLVDVDFRAELSDLRSGCIYAKQEGGASKLVVAVAPAMVAVRGPANEDRKADFQYFVSVVGRDADILNKQLFPVSVTFAGNSTRVDIVQDDPPVSIDLPAGAEGEAYYEILLGLQLSEDELEYTRRLAGAR
ncbi:MAG TPA: hypothetical protein VLR47_12220 [Rhodospirillales bacterium]|nr:hypothetical protein [Rhodospirillales bacterium]